jgi:transposase
MFEPASRAGADEAFLREEFFDARDAVQVKYEMVRRVVVEADSVTAAAAAFGYSKPSYYAAAAALAASGLEGLVAAKPGPRGGHKLTETIVIWAREQLVADPDLRPARLIEPIAAQFGVRVHPRSIERALARHQERPKRH